MMCSTAALLRRGVDVFCRYSIELGRYSWWIKSSSSYDCALIAAADTAAAEDDDDS